MDLGGIKFQETVGSKGLKFDFQSLDPVEKMENNFKNCLRGRVGKSETGIWEKCRDQCCFHGSRIAKNKICQLEKDLGLQPSQCRAKCYQCKMKNVKTAFEKYLFEKNPSGYGVQGANGTNGGVAGYNNCLKVSVLNLISDDSGENKIQINKFENSYEKCSKKICGKFPCAAEGAQKSAAQIADCVYTNDVKEAEKFENLYCASANNKKQCQEFKNYLVKKYDMIKNKSIQNKSRNYWETKIRDELENCQRATCGGQLCSKKQQEDNNLREKWEGCGLQRVTQAKDQISENCSKICCGLDKSCSEENKF